MPSHQPLFYERRNETIDNIHMGYVCIVDENSNLIYHLGDPGEYVFYRSASKPIQALPVILRNLDQKYGITEEESVVFSASHSGEPYFVEKLTSIFEKTGLTEEMMIMKPTYPLDSKSAFELKKDGRPPRKIYHNCAGKHIATMLLQRELGGKLSDYWLEDSPAQIEIKRAVMTLSETEPATTRLGVDGCGVPVFAVGIKQIAVGYKNLAALDTIPDQGLQDTARRYLPRIHKYPHMIRGTDKLCTLLNQDPNIISKGGAAGVYGLGLKRERLGISFKVTSGEDYIWPLILKVIFEQLGGQRPETLAMLDRLCPETVLNDNDFVVGRYESLISLRSG